MRRGYDPRAPSAGHDSLTPATEGDPIRVLGVEPPSGETEGTEWDALGTLLGHLVLARLEPLSERQVLTAIKRATGIAASLLEKQIGELRRWLNTTGDIHRQPTRPHWAANSPIEPSTRQPTGD